MSKSELIPFRAVATPGANFGINCPIYFPDGTKGVIRSLIQVSENREGQVCVIGKYRKLGDSH